MRFSKMALAIAGIAGALAIGTTAISAQSATPSARMTNDDKMQDCSRYSRAYERVESAKNGLSNLYKAFDENDPVKNKIEAIVTQLNDAEITIRKRTTACPANMRG